MAERIRSRIDSKEIPVKDTTLRISASMGVSCAQEKGELRLRTTAVDSGCPGCTGKTARPQPGGVGRSGQKNPALHASPPVCLLRVIHRAGLSSCSVMPGG